MDLLCWNLTSNTKDKMFNLTKNPLLFCLRALKRKLQADVLRRTERREISFLLEPLSAVPSILCP